MPKFQLRLDGHWKDYTHPEEELLKRAFMEGKPGVSLQARGQKYYCDFKNMVQRNVETGKEREIRVIYDGEGVDDSPQRPAAGRPAAGRPAAQAAPILGVPVVGVCSPPPVCHGHGHGCAPAAPAAPAVGPSAAQALYGAPAPAYGAAAPAPGYMPGAAPAYAAAAPAPAYAMPAPGYGAPAYGGPGPAYGAAPPAYAPYPAAGPPGGYGYGAPSGAGAGVSPMTAALAAGAAGLLGGMILEDILD